jgi:uncharacterized protein (TIGR02598 family)
MNSLNVTAAPRRHLAPAFSLIETVLALGIMGLAITALLGLLPHGIQMSKKAADASAQSRIIDVISSRLSNLPFDQLQAQDNQRVLFDDQGVQLGLQDSQSAIYVARVRVFTGTDSITLPGAGGTESLVARVIVQITNIPNPDFNFDTAPPESYQSVPLLFGPTNS